MLQRIEMDERVGLAAQLAQEIGPVATGARCRVRRPPAGVPVYG
jgi:hypothetical protein